VSIRRLRTYLIVSVALAAIALAATFASGDEPVLGLDLQGGISIVYAPQGKFKPGALDVARDIIENRVNGLGVAEPEISRQGDNIVVDLPGVKDRDKARRVVGRTAELRFRGVLGVVPPAGSTASTTTSTPASTLVGAPTSAATTTTTTLSPTAEAVKGAIASCDLAGVRQLVTAGVSVPTTSVGDDKRDACVVLPEKGQHSRLYLGKAELTGKAVDQAKASFVSGSGWTVSMKLTSSGSDAWDKMAAKYFHQQVAIELDGVVQSAPTIQPNAPTFSSFNGTAEISGSFDQSQAEDLATIINYGALPVQLKELTVQNVSPTLGQDQLDAGIAAGVVGLALVALYMLVYYRLLGLVVIVGIMISASYTYAIVTFLSHHSELKGIPGAGLTLTLAGVTGLIVSIGVTVDSYVVYFERLKDEVRTGKTVRSSVDRGFTRSFRTIVAADLVSLLGALALYFIAIGSVRGFAFYLGLSTFLDLGVAYFFMHPIVSLMARRPELVRMRGVGIAMALDTPEAVA
jgi:preprotein translocase subunit SecD